MAYYGIYDILQDIRLFFLFSVAISAFVLLFFSVKWVSETEFEEMRRYNFYLEKQHYTPMSTEDLLNYTYGENQWKWIMKGMSYEISKDNKKGDKPGRYYFWDSI